MEKSHLLDLCQRRLYDLYMQAGRLREAGMHEEHALLMEEGFDMNNLADDEVLSLNYLGAND